MTQIKKNQKDSKAAQRAADSKAINDARKERRTRFAIAGVILVIILAIVGFFYYQQYVAPFRLAIITVDDTKITMDYFLKRAQLSGADTFTMLDRLLDEQLVKLGVSRYGIAVESGDIDLALKAMANASGNTTLSDSEFKEWYRQNLNESQLSEAEFRDSVRTGLLAFRLQQYLAEKVPTVAEQVHAYTIVTTTYDDIVKVKERLDAGEDFSAVAQEVSIDGSRTDGGDLGWLPRGIRGFIFDTIAFELGIGAVSEPFAGNEIITSPTEEPTYHIVKVSEKSVARELDAGSLQALQNSALDYWLASEISAHEIAYNGFNGSFDSETNAWISWQLARRSKSTSSSTGTGGGQ